jgi:hypothetical protein
MLFSPSDPSAAMTEKRALCFEAGARKVCLCGSHGKMEFSAPDLLIHVLLPFFGVLNLFIVPRVGLSIECQIAMTIKRNLIERN